MKKYFLILVAFVVVSLSGGQSFAKNNATINDKLVATCEGHNLKRVRLYIKKGADINYDYGAPLCAACKNGNTEIVEFLLKNGADPDGLRTEEYSCTPLVLSIYYGYNNYSDICKLLLEYGANPDASLEYFGTALYFACTKENIDLDLVKSLLEHGAEPNGFGRFSMTSLYSACADNNIELAKLLLEYGADPNLRDGMFMETPLDVAISNGNTELINLLRK